MEKIEEVLKALDEGRMKISEAERILGISRPTIYKRAEEKGYNIRGRKWYSKRVEMYRKFLREFLEKVDRIESLKELRELFLSKYKFISGAAISRLIHKYPDIREMHFKAIEKYYRMRKKLMWKTYGGGSKHE